MTRQLRCVIMRGGTSKAVFLKEADLPEDEAERTRTILSVFGSPDRRQIDGLGGADPLTSKLAVIGPVRTGEPRAAGTHLTHTFGQVEITRLLAAPGQMGPLRLKNRVIMAPMGTNYGTTDGFSTERDRR